MNSNKFSGGFVSSRIFYMIFLGYDTFFYNVFTLSFHIGLNDDVFAFVAFQIQISYVC